MNFSYDDILKHFETDKFDIDPSEVHGLVCGVICGESSSTSPNFDDILGEKVPEKITLLLNTLFEMSEKQLRDFSFEFQLLLPDDNQSLSHRTEALTLWVQGFFTGLNLKKININLKDKSEISEAMRDLMEITKLNYNSVPQNEDNENDYMELSEYVRMAVNLIYQELHPQSSASTQTVNNNVLH